MKQAIFILVLNLICAGLLLSQQVFIDPTLEVGTLPGDFSVSLTGAATYSIPIKLPEGRAGLTPTLTLNYNSQGGNGLLGAKWTIGGLSTINRTGTNLYNEDFIDGVDFEDDDRFTLNGQRLIPIDETLIEYRTEYETFSRVIAHGADLSNPDWFEVFTKDGRILEYGNNDNACHSELIPTNKTETLAWQVNRIKDRQGNYVDYYYEEGIEAGKISKIKYTGSSRNNKEPFYEVAFEYDIRNDNSIQYISGGYIEKKSLLNSISISYLSNTVQSYNLNYNYQNLVPRLESISTSDKNGQSLNPTVFNYGSANNSYDIYTTNINDNGQEVDYTMGDFNGDGNTDIVCAYYTIVNGNRNNESWSVFYSTGDGNTFTESPSFELETDFLYFIPGDYNGDGIDDLVKVYPSVFKFFIKDEGSFILKAQKIYMGSITHTSSGTFLQGLFSTIFGGAATANGSISTPINNGLKNIDINGNGKDEILLINYDLGDGYAIMKSFELDGNNLIDVFFREYNNGGTNFEAGYVFHNSSPDLNPVAAGDYTGDGKTNLVLNTEPNKSIILELDVITNDPYPVLVEINPNGYNYPTQNTNTNYVGDFNGDGIADLFARVNNVWAVRHFDGKNGWVTGSSITIPTPPQYGEYVDVEYALSDFNGDGKTDVLAIYQEYYQDYHMSDPEFINPHWDVYYSTGNGFVREGNTLPFKDIKTCYMEGVQFLDINGDGKSECLMREKHDRKARIMFFHKDEQSYNITKITNGLGAETVLTYESISNSDSYTKGTGANYPVVDIQYPLLVVTKSEQDNGMGGYFEKVYEYESLIAHKQGKGSLGFQKLICTDKQSNIQTITEYGLIDNNNLYYYSFPEIITQHPLDYNGEVVLSEKISETINTVSLKTSLPGNNFVFYPVVTKSIEKIWDNESDNTFVKMISTTQPLDRIDQWGNSLSSRVIISKEESGTRYASTVFESRFYNDEVNWILGQPKNTTVTSAVLTDPEESITEIDYIYYGPGSQSWPLIKSKTITPNNKPLYANETLFEYNIYGNITKTIIKVRDLSIEENPPTISRTTEYEYKDTDNYNGRFLTSIIKNDGVVNYTNSYEYNLSDGLLSTSTDASGLVTEFMYDNFGRLIRTTFPDQTYQHKLIVWIENTIMYLMAPEKCIYGESIINSDQSLTLLYKDKLGREIRTISPTGINNAWLGVDKVYNAKGQICKISEPYFVPNYPSEDDYSQWTHYFYDPLNNKLKYSVAPTNTIVKFEYRGLSTTATNQSTGINKTETVDPLGRKLTVTDPAGDINYTYYSNGNVKTVNSLGSITEMYYDAAGRQRTIIEPNFNTTEYLYSNFGELLKQTDNKGNTYNMAYDQLGRLSTKTLENVNEVTTYKYYTKEAENGFGMLESIIGANDICYKYIYDELDRLQTENEIIGGISYTSQYEYNSNGKLDSFVYPSGYSVSYQYTDRGELFRVLDGNNEGKVLWQADAINRRGQLTNFTLGNGLSTEKAYNDISGLLESITTGQVQNLEYKFDQVTGNLNWRRDNRYNLTETFTYDELLQSRLETWKVNNDQTFGIIYNSNGNILKKTDITQDSNPLSVYQYGQNAGPNAVTTILNPAREYNQVATPQNIKYTAFNKVCEIRQTKVENKKENLLFYKLIYGPDNVRKVSYLFEDENMIKLKQYIGSNYEIEIDPSGQKRKIHYISGSDGLFAIYVQKGKTNTMYYIQKDHLGSYYCVTDEHGDIVLSNRVEQVYNFDPWGRERNETDWTYKSEFGERLFDRGYTGHEHLDDFGLINMNGRCYDPWLGRMLSPDPFIQAPDYSQNHNRYTYALNNPLKYVDPTGYSNIMAIINQLLYSSNGGHWSAGDAVPTFFSSATDASNYVNNNFSQLTSGGSAVTQRNIVQIFDNQGNSHYYDKNSGEMWNPETGSYIPGADLFPGQVFYDGNGNIEQVFLPEEVEIVENDQAGVDVTPYVDFTLSVGSAIMFSNKFGTWMGKDFKIRSQDWGGNGTTGGKFKFAGKVSKLFKWGGSAIGVYGIVDTQVQYQNNEISGTQAIIQQISNGIGFIPTYGTAWSIGWNLGQDFGPSTWYGKNDYKWFE